jgi:nucleoside-diphosphate-sugar epimerase
MKVLVTGATGFVGGHLANYLASQGHKVFALGRKASLETCESLDESVEKVGLEESMQSQELLDIVRSLEIEVVYHAATLFLKAHNIGDVGPLVESNLKFGINLAEAASMAGVKTFVNFSSIWQLKQRGANESQKTLYAATKQAFLEVLKFYAFSSGPRVLNIYLNDTFGANDNRSKLVPAIRKAIVDSQSFRAINPGARINLSLVDDVVETVAELARNTVEDFAEFEIRSDRSYTISEIVQAMERVSGCQLDFQTGVSLEESDDDSQREGRTSSVKTILLKRDFEDGLLQANMFR